MYTQFGREARFPKVARTASAAVCASALFLGTLLSPMAPAALASNAALTPGSLNLTATFNSIGVELKFSGDDNANASAGLEFKKSADPTWRAALPLWRTDDGSTSPGRAFYGSALLVDPGVGYDVRVTLTDPDGVAGTAVLTGSVVTRAEDIPAASTLAPTHFVSVTGNDANPGTSATSSWRTLDKALKSAPAGAVVRFGPGYFKNSSTTRTMPLTLVAQYPAVDDTRTPINMGKHTIVDAGVVSASASSTATDVAKAPWQQITFVDPLDSSKSYRVWEWPTSGLSNASQLGYSTNRVAEPKRIAQWTKDSLELATPAGWAKKLYTNKTYNYGFYPSGQDIYLRLPGDLDPNTLTLTAGFGWGLRFDGPNMRVSGLEVRQFNYGIWFGPNSSRGVVDHSELSGNLANVAFQGLAGTPPLYGADHVIQYNRLADSSLWTANHTNDPGIPWTFIKSQIVNADGSLYPTRRIGTQSESTSVYSKSGGAHRVVIRDNTIDGSFNGVSIYPAGWTDRYANQDMDVYDNFIRHIADDALEPSGQNINFRAWGNRIEDASVALSSDPLEYGPVFFFRNEGWRLGQAGVPFDAQGQPTLLKSPFFKYDDGSLVRGRIYVLHNTLWSDPSLSNSLALGGADYGGSSGGVTDAFYLRNNIIHTTEYAFDVSTTGMWDEDYNHFSTSDATRGFEYVDQHFTTDVAAYRAATAQGAHTNLTGNFVTTPLLTNPRYGDITLPLGSPLIDAGVPVPNLSDRAGVDYTGSAPDLGASER